MAIDYASKYSTEIDERFKLAAVTTPAVNNDFDFVGTKTVKVYSVPTSAMNDYKRTGTNRYGNPEELGNETQELTLSKDRSFTFTIDRGNYNDTMMTNAAGTALQRQIDEVITPEIDIYRISKMAENAGSVGEGAITNKGAYSAFLDGTMALTEKKVPKNGRIAFVTSQYYKLIKQDDSFIKSGDLSQNMLVKDQVGQIDGVPIVVVPSTYFPENAMFLITNSIATVAPIKLAEYKIHDNPPGINGWLVEGRVYYDAFVLNNKKNAVYVHYTTAPTGA